MRNNTPVTQREYDYPASELIVSSTDQQGRITHCNHAFERVSGFSYQELMGQPHNLVRHPDMPEAAFKDLWTTVGRGRPWTGMVKNRRKDGDHYWVMANVTPIIRNGKPSGYMSVRVKPTRAQIEQAEALYARMRKDSDAGRVTCELHAGHVRQLGLRDLPARIWRLNTSGRLTLALGALVAAVLLPQWLGLFKEQALWFTTASLLGGALLLRAWFQRTVQRSLDQVEHVASEIAACNMMTPTGLDSHDSIGSVRRSLAQMQLNVRAVIGDVRTEIAGFSAASAEIATSSQNLSSRTEAQASSLQETAASMEQLSSTLSQSAQTVTEVARHASDTNTIAQSGGAAIDKVSHTIESITKASGRMMEIISVIEGIAFQTNILALNAAVEAARAGDQGRGFAVVASEVRALAHRSADAAKEIHSLITDSNSRITDGAEQMAQASETIRQVVQAVDKVGNLVQQITGSAHEQALGVSQVNDAVTHLDGVTQQNAAMVEESAAAADLLNRRTETLKRSVAVFLID